MDNIDEAKLLNKKPMPIMPVGFSAYKKTKQFNQDTIPKGLLKEHTTIIGTWGKLIIEYGSLVYCITEPGYESLYELDPSTPGIIVAEQHHHIRAQGEVSFHVEFYRDEIAE